MDEDGSGEIEIGEFLTIFETQKIAKEKAQEEWEEFVKQVSRALSPLGLAFLVVRRNEVPAPIPRFSLQPLAGLDANALHLPPTKPPPRALKGWRGVDSGGHY